MAKILVTGAGGFIGTHLVDALKRAGHWVRGADLKRPEWSKSMADEFWQLDLRDRANCLRVCTGVDQIYHLAADMGGMGFITTKQAEIIGNNTLINVHMIHAARDMGVERLLFSSSACVYPIHKQRDDVEYRPLREGDVYPAMPQESYGWEKLHMEHLCAEFRRVGWIDARWARFHNCYGPYGAWEGGREKAPAALSRKIAWVKLSGDPVVKMWGDGGAIRSYMYVDDCVYGLMLLMEMDNFYGVINLGQDREISVDDLAYLIAGIAETEIVIDHVPGPQGVRRRNSDNRACFDLLGWAPTIPLEAGMVVTYEWIEEQVQAKYFAEAQQ